MPSLLMETPSWAWVPSNPQKKRTHCLRRLSQSTCCPHANALSHPFLETGCDENNLFTVGDVKQSIYRFRQAMPEIFLRRRSTTHSFESGKYPLGITLGSNFRSRVGVTSCVNYIFRQLMSTEAGELEYDDSEALNAAAKYPERDTPDCELHVVTDKGNRADTLEAQARYVAKYIERTVREGKMLVTQRS